MAVESEVLVNVGLSRLGRVIDAVRASTVRIHCITSLVAAERTANTLLAFRVRPSLTINAEEIQQFTRASDALLVNLGMLDPMRRAAIPLAVDEARNNRKPWVLDPVFANVSATRRSIAMTLLGLSPTVFKANRSESFLIDSAPANTVRVVTGAVDFIEYSGKKASIAYGAPVTAQVTATGCALGAVIAACLAVEPDPFLAASAALLAYGLAAQKAAHTATGPGSFSVAFYDALAAMDGKTLEKDAVIR